MRVGDAHMINKGLAPGGGRAFVVGARGRLLLTKTPEEMEAEGRHQALERPARVALEEGVEAAMRQWEDERSHRE
jgi:hypothetical protein